MSAPLPLSLSISYDREARAVFRGPCLIASHDAENRQPLRRLYAPYLYKVAYGLLQNILVHTQKIYN